MLSKFIFISAHVVTSTSGPNHPFGIWLESGLLCFGAQPVPVGVFFLQRLGFFSVFKGQAATRLRDDANNFRQIALKPCMIAKCTFNAVPVSFLVVVKKQREKLFTYRAEVFYTKCGVKK